jgi:4-aminobutyrate aminotransferase
LGEGILRFQPPLVITREEIDKAIDVIEESMKEFLAGDIPDEILETTKGWKK